MFGKKRTSRLRLLDVLALGRAYVPEQPGPDEAREFEAAKQRCLDCHMTTLCDEALQASDPRGFSRFCPNSAYLQYVRRRTLNF